MQQRTLYFRPYQFIEACRPPSPTVLIFIRNLVLFLISDCQFSVIEEVGKQAVQEINILRIYFDRTERLKPVAQKLPETTCVQVSY